jgi:hypothetical protein
VLNDLSWARVNDVLGAINVHQNHAINSQKSSSRIPKLFRPVLVRLWACSTMGRGKGVSEVF